MTFEHLYHATSHQPFGRTDKKYESCHISYQDGIWQSTRLVLMLSYPGSARCAGVWQRPRCVPQASSPFSCWFWPFLWPAKSRVTSSTVGRWRTSLHCPSSRGRFWLLFWCNVIILGLWGTPELGIAPNKLPVSRQDSRQTGGVCQVASIPIYMLC